MLVEDLVNRALDAAGSERTIGDIQEGTREAQICLRHYLPCVEQLLRSAHWDFSRKTAPMAMLADATGNTPAVGKIVPVPWTYEYQYPIDCMKARFVPANPFQTPANVGPPGNISLPATPLFPVQQPTTNLGRVRPARFLVATDFNYPIDPGSNWWEQQGTAPDQRTVILTNVQNAQLVYTARMIYPNTWDALFQQAMVALLASEIALPLAKDKKFGLALRDRNIAIARDKIGEARRVDGNEGWYNTDHTPDWIRTRNTGAWGNGWWGPGNSAVCGPGIFFGGWDQCSFADGSAF